MRLLVFMAVLLPVILFAQSAPPLPQSAAGGGGAVPSKPDLLNLAYENMMAGNYAKAEEQYRSLKEAEPENLSAHEGYLWALNAQKKFSVSLKESGKLLKQYPANSQFYNYRAYPLLEKKRLPEARYFYLKAAQNQAANPIGNQISQEGLAYTYDALGDYLRYDRHLQANAALTHIPARKPKPEFSSTVAFALPGKDKSSLNFAQGVGYKTWHLSLGYNDFSVNQKHFRSLTSAAVVKQFIPFDLKAGAILMDGIDERVYPAKQADIRLTPKLYAGSLVLRPAVMASFSSYSRFDVQQISFLPELLWRDLTISYAAHYSYMDNKTVDADSTRFAQQVLIAKSMPWNTTLGLHYGSGDNCWMVDSSGSVMDTFEQQSAYYGVSLLVPFLNRYSIYAYHNVQDNRQLWYASLTVRY
ncbi:MAG: hypothetical protein CVU50_07510 [Candidatus Cloacimonetes bacterium HGW-Cloacimonetes-3]|jgi:tetratricopeptide (TPR) repeat protein|nr:MAG: hypothetical protein CVU50_07510 [Candidatus Cloacimonetes bacterium HGW-Cloacimonetes-3]